jgi:hypothetical protein
MHNRNLLVDCTPEIMVRRQQKVNRGASRIDRPVEVQHCRFAEVIGFSSKRRSRRSRTLDRKGHVFEISTQRTITRKRGSNCTIVEGK